MMRMERFLAVVRALDACGVEYIVIGGAAMNVQGIVRATEDMDVFVRPTQENIDRLKRALRCVWDDPAIEEISYEDLSGDYPSVRYGPPEDDIYLDILVRLGEMHSFDSLDSEIVEMDGTPVRVATKRTLFRMKSSTVRPVDHFDAEMLQQLFDLEEN